MTAVMDLPAPPATSTRASASYRDLTEHQRTTWHLALEKAHDAIQQRDITAFRTIHELTAVALGLSVPHGTELVECSCDTCYCDAIGDEATYRTANGLPQCPTCTDEHPHSDD
ncbi:hypothetical protein [Streptomyces sp. Ac-502]|uniref:hypothetical protein n=1 Tax=Streptomyces sp. Ac-502 TaxID=3342801 RepID=UPI0038628927